MFYNATAAGIPAGAAPAGTDTMTWLSQQPARAGPELKAAVAPLVNYWQQIPPDLIGIKLAGNVIKADCRPYGGA